MKLLPSAVFAASVAMLSGAPFAHAADEPQAGQRLIRTAGGERWMYPEEIVDLMERSHDAGHCGGFMDVTAHPLPKRAVAEPWALLERAPSQQAAVNAVLPKLKGSNVVATVKALSAFNNRYYTSDTGEAAALWIRDTFKKLAKKRPDVTVELFNHEFRQPSVIVRIPGTGKLAKEKVVLGAHEDSINWSHGNRGRSKARAPGADDNASGVAVLLEVFRGLMQADYHPARTVEFMAYAGEELGLLGSQDIAEAYAQDNAEVVAVLQMDMTLFPGKGHKVTFITDNVSDPLTRFAEKLMDTYVKTPWQESSCGYACSDHASWDNHGYPTVFPFETDFDEANPSVHTLDDTLEAGLEGDFGLEFAKLNTAFAMEMAAP